MDRLVFLDTETTGGSREDRIIEIGMVEVIGGRITGSRFHALVSTHRPVHWAAKRVHGISDRDLIGKPRFAEIAPDVLSFLDGALPMAHNAPFDGGMLSKEWDDLDLPASRRPVLRCTMPIASAIGGPVSLDGLIGRYLPAQAPRGKHSAVEDAELLARVFLRMREEHPSAVEGALARRLPGMTRGPVAARRLPPARVSGKPVLDAPAVDAAVAARIAEANAARSVEKAIDIRTGRDGFSRMGREDLCALLGPDARFADDVPEDRRLPALRMMARGLLPELAVAREEHFAEIYGRPTGLTY